MLRRAPALASLFLTVATLVLAPARASAQQCAEGRVVTPDTQGRCCWPGQRWSDEHNRCDGPPQCPPGWLGDGGGCVREEAPAPATPPVTAPVPEPEAAPAAPPVSPPPVSPPQQQQPAVAGVGSAVREMLPSRPPSDWRETFDSTRYTGAAATTFGGPHGGAASRREEPNHPTLAAGTALLLSGYIPAVFAAIDLLTRPFECNAWGAAYFAPVIGGAIGGGGLYACWGNLDYGGWYWDGPSTATRDALGVTGFVASAVQIVGLIVLIAGASSPRVTYVAEVGDARVAFTGSGFELSF